jgi:hypothetical protein
VKLGPLKLDWSHMAATALALLSLYGPTLLPPGSLNSLMMKLGPYGALASFVAALFLRSVLPADSAKKMPGAGPAMGIMFVLSVLAAGCTKQQVAQFFTDQQVACQAEALAQALIPAGTPAATVAADIQSACGIAPSLEQDVITIVEAFEANQADAGTAPKSGTYTPAPFVLKAKMSMGAGH